MVFVLELSQEFFPLPCTTIGRGGRHKQKCNNHLVTECTHVSPSSTCNVLMIMKQVNVSSCLKTPQALTIFPVRMFHNLNYWHPTWTSSLTERGGEFPWILWIFACLLRLYLAIKTKFTPKHKSIAQNMQQITEGQEEGGWGSKSESSLTKVGISFQTQVGISGETFNLTLTTACQCDCGEPQINSQQVFHGHHPRCRCRRPPLTNLMSPRSTRSRFPHLSASTGALYMKMCHCLQKVRHQTFAFSLSPMTWCRNSHAGSFLQCRLKAVHKTRATIFTMPCCPQTSLLSHILCSV